MARVVILGNCQAQLLEAMFLQAVPGIVLERFPPVFDLTAADEAAVTRAMEAADVVFVQRTSPGFPLRWLTPTALRVAAGSRAVIWPNVYFDGYFPHTRYIYRPDGQKLLSPLEDYHLAPLVDAYRRGASVRDGTLALFAPPPGDPFEASFGQLERREQDTDLRISDLLREVAPCRRALYTPNHPYNAVLIELAARMAAHAGLRFGREAAAAVPYRLDRIYIPAFPGIVHQLRLPFDQITIFRGREVLSADHTCVRLGAARSFLAEELVEASWRIYDALPP